MRKVLVYTVLIIVFNACDKKEGELFETLAVEESGITFQNTLTETDDLNILDYLYFYNGGGVAIGDINGDELPDIYFSGNQVKNKLYLNKGGLTFEDITDKAGVAGNSSWNTGAVMGDVNGDGLLDIYVCAVVGINGFNGFNELYINNGDSTFTERAAEFGLDFDSYSSNAAFLDYDQDGDLDLYLLNHAVHTQESFGNSQLRTKRNYQTGDKLLRNDQGKFIDVSEQAGIYGGVNGYGLGIAISDFNMDGYPDIYVGNDFHEDDYYYLNNQDGTFTERIKEYFGYTSRFSMGNDVADINHDGWPDIISLDMLPEDEKVLKSSEGDDDIQTQKMRTEWFGYHYQFTRNMLYINQPGNTYSETALFSGIAATDWSWSALFGDYDQDGEQDIFITNGIPKRPNDLDFINFVSDEQIKKKINNTKLVDQQALNMMPTGTMHNYIFKGSDSLRFKDMSGKWITKDSTISGATATADLDGDGDLELVTSNSNAAPTIYINKTDSQANYLKIKFRFKAPNTFGIGTKVFSYHQGKLQYKELYTVRGFQASSTPAIHFGYGKEKKVDSLRIIWPDNTSQLVKDIEVNQNLTLSPANVQGFNYESLKPVFTPVFKKVENRLGIHFTHKEDNYIDFNRQKLIPYRLSDRGPATAIGDLNNDGKTDIFFGSSKYTSSRVYMQADSSYMETKLEVINRDSIKEDVAAVIEDFDQDGNNDLFIGSGGADFFGKRKPLLDSYFLQKDSLFIKNELADYFENASVVIAEDFDGDGDPDLFVGNHGVTNDFGKIPRSYLLRNEGGAFTEINNEALQTVGMVTDALWDDFDSDGVKDLIVVGEWMSPRFFKNHNGVLKEVSVLDTRLNGLWQCLTPFDIDNDGDTDYILGNWGTNNKFKATDKNPLKMYYSDFDDNGSTETVVAVYKNGAYYPTEGLDGLASQMEMLRKKFTTYTSFAGKNLEQIFETKALNAAKLFTVNVLHSGYLENNKGRFSFVPFKNALQLAPITALLVYDFDGDTKTEILAAGNYLGVKPYHGKFDSFEGAMIKSKNDVILGGRLGLDLTLKSARDLNIITLNNQPFVLVTFNNEEVQVYELLNKKGE